GPDANSLQEAGLTLNPLSRVRSAVGQGAARYVHPRTDQHITFQVCQSDVASRTDINIVFNSCPNFGEDRAEFHQGTRVTILQDLDEESSAKVLAYDSWDQGQSLRRAFQRPVPA